MTRTPPPMQEGERTVQVPDADADAHDTEIEKKNPFQRRKLSDSGSSATATATATSTGDDEDCMKFLAKELSKLDVTDRERVFYDLHGILDTTKEDPVKIDQLLQQMDYVLSQCKHETYLAALEQNRDLVTSRKFRLQFLRCEQYDVKEAATHIVKYLELKRLVFGMDMLTTKITLENMGERGRKCVESGMGVSHKD